MCAPCVLRARCGGAWHAYWTHRAGSGIAPPARVRAPWEDGSDEAAMQDVVAAPGGPTDEAWAALAASRAPSTWLWTDRLAVDDAAAVLASRCTHLALDVEAAAFERARSTLRALRTLRSRAERLQPQRRVALHVGLRTPADDGDARVIYRGVALAAALGADAVRILGESRFADRVVALAQRRIEGVDIARAHPSQELVNA